jgi:hypothetical protein
VSCGAGAVHVVAHGFVRTQQLAGESVRYSKLAMRRLLARLNRAGWVDGMPLICCSGQPAVTLLRLRRWSDRYGRHD